MNWDEFHAMTQKPSRVVAGVMSGTSADGLDVAVARCTGSGKNMLVDLLFFKSFPYEESFKERIISAYDPRVSTVATVNKMNFEIARTHSRMVDAALRESPARVDLIGYHGQTVYHDPSAGATLQIGEPDVMSATIGLPVVSGFRTKDVVLGGQGAPLIPYLDWILYSPGTVAVNIGGITNMTLIGETLDRTVAFDTGPGNCLLDIVALGRFKEPYDSDGELSGQGSVDQKTLALLVERNRSFSEKHPPKSTGREIYNREFLTGTECCDPYDLMRTLAEFTVAELWKHITRYAPKAMKIIVTGGGAYNRTIVELLKKLSDCEVAVPEDGLIEAKEAMGMAVLAHEFFNGTPANVPSSTGASRKCILGKLSLP